MAQETYAAGDGKQLAVSEPTADGYRFVLFDAEVVAVQKASVAPGFGMESAEWKTAYVIRGNVCPCQGHQYRGTCKHIEPAQRLIEWGRQNLPGAAETPPTGT